VTNYRDKSEQYARNSERSADHNAKQAEPEALKRMKTHEAIFTEGLNKKENNRRKNETVGECTGQGLRQTANSASRALRRAHGATTAGTKGSIIGHLCGAVGAGDQHEV
jgi:hypothetical protein